MENEILKIKTQIESAVCHALDKNGLCSSEWSCTKCMQSVFKLLNQEWSKFE